MDKIFLTGMPRGGTSLLNFLLSYFNNCGTINEEHHPLFFDNAVYGNYKHFIIKQPFGYWKAFSPKYLYKDILDRNIRIISIVRDPRDVLVSRHNIDKSIYWVSLEIVKRCCKEHLKEFPDNLVFKLTYEDLVSDTENIMSKLSQFIGEDFSNSYIRFYENVGGSLMKALNVPRPIDTNSIGNWKNEEHKDRIVEIYNDAELVDLIHMLGYK